MDFDLAVLILQEAQGVIFDHQPDFSHLFAKPILPCLGGEPKYVPIYRDDALKWSFPFLFALLNELDED
jgi:hypothetical protein